MCVSDTEHRGLTCDENISLKQTSTGIYTGWHPESPIRRQLTVTTVIPLFILSEKTMKCKVL